MQPHDTTQLSPRINNITGQRFGRLTVLSFSHMNKGRRAVWNCECDCGAQCQVEGTKLATGRTKSCGCLRPDAARENNSTHGHSTHYLWNTYAKMIARCYTPSDKSYKRYGARGITVCERWRESFVNFLADMGDRPDGCSIDRIDNDGPYAPENCRWATLSQQNSNTRQNHNLTYDGETLTIAQWSLRLGISQHTIRNRLRYGWSVERTLTEPVSPLLFGKQVRK